MAFTQNHYFNLDHITISNMRKWHPYFLWALVIETITFIFSWLLNKIWGMATDDDGRKDDFFLLFGIFFFRLLNDSAILQLCVYVCGGVGIIIMMVDAIISKVWWLWLWWWWSSSPFRVVKRADVSVFIWWNHVHTFTAPSASFSTDDIS